MDVLARLYSTISPQTDLAVDDDLTSQCRKYIGLILTRIKHCPGRPTAGVMLSARCLHPAPFTSYSQCPRGRSCSRLCIPHHSTFSPHANHARQSTVRRKWQCSASAGAEPELSAGAIAMGLKAYEKADYNEAIGLFKQALTLPGTGLKQYRDKPAIASDGEKISAYYNIACCLSRTGNIHDGLLALLEALQMGYEDFDQLRQDPDLEAIRADSKFEPLMSRFQKVNRQNILQSFIGNLKNPLQR